MAASPIPIQNLYYLLCYSWNVLSEMGVIDVDKLESTELADLFALVLTSGVRHLARRGLDREYIAQQEVLTSIRGRIDMTTSARRFMFVHGKAQCEFDELSTDTLPNRILKGTLKLLSDVPELDTKLRRDVRRMLRRLPGISDIHIRDADFAHVNLHANNRYYRFLLCVCELIHGSWLVDERTGKCRFRDFLRDDKRMAAVFQNFVLNFYRRHRPTLRARSEQIEWRASSVDANELALLPRMITDITLDLAETTLIIDTKYYGETLSAHYGTQKVHSENLYQLMTYLTNAGLPESKQVEGMLLYPVVDRALRLRYTIQGFPVRVCTLDLAQKWQGIERELLALVDGPNVPDHHPRTNVAEVAVAAASGI